MLSTDFYECSELETCKKGFYTPSNDGANAAKAQSLYIRKYEKMEFYEQAGYNNTDKTAFIQWIGMDR